MAATLSHFVFYDDVEMVAGHDDALIIDLQRSATYRLSIDSYHYLRKLETEGADVSTDDRPEVQDFLDYLTGLEVGFLTTQPASFPSKDRHFKRPFHFENAVAEVSDSSALVDVIRFVEQLVELATPALHLRFTDFRTDVLEWVGENTLASGIQRIELAVNVTNTGEADLLRSLLERNGRLVLRYFSDIGPLEYGSDYRTFPLPVAVTGGWSDQPMITMHRLVFREAQHYNVGLHRKISLTHDGQLKNFLTHPTSFGSVQHTPLIDLLENPEFTRFWSVGNDEVEICRSCVLRYNCVSTSPLIRRGGKWFRRQYCEFRTDSGGQNDLSDVSAP